MKTAIAIAAAFAFCATLQATESEPPKPDPSCKYEVVTRHCSKTKECEVQEGEFEDAITKLMQAGWRPVGGIHVMLIEGMEIGFGKGKTTRFFRQAMSYNCEPVRSEPKSEPAEPKSQGG